MDRMDYVEGRLAMHFAGAMLVAEAMRGRTYRMVRLRPLPAGWWDPQSPSLADIPVDNFDFISETLALPADRISRLTSGRIPNDLFLVSIWDTRKCDGKIRWDPRTVEFVQRLRLVLGGKGQIRCSELRHF